MCRAPNRYRFVFIRSFVDADGFFVAATIGATTVAGIVCYGAIRIRLVIGVVMTLGRSRWRGLLGISLASGIREDEEQHHTGESLGQLGSAHPHEVSRAPVNVNGRCRSVDVEWLDGFLTLFGSARRIEPTKRKRRDASYRLAATTTRHSEREEANQGERRAVVIRRYWARCAENTAPFHNNAALFACVHRVARASKWTILVQQAFHTREGRFVADAFVTFRILCARDASARRFVAE